MKVLNQSKAETIALMTIGLVFADVMSRGLNPTASREERVKGARKLAEVLVEEIDDIELKTRHG